MVDSGEGEVILNRGHQPYVINFKKPFTAEILAIQLLGENVVTFFGDRGRCFAALGYILLLSPRSVFQFSSRKLKQLRKCVTPQKLYVRRKIRLQVLSPALNSQYLQLMGAELKLCRLLSPRTLPEPHVSLYYFYVSHRCSV